MFPCREETLLITKDTDEGLDISMALLYYSRMRFATQLLPLLRASKLPAHVVSVYAGGMESSGSFFPEDLPLERPGHYSFSNCRAHVVYMKTMFFEQLAKQNEGKVAFVHSYPSIVITPGYGNPNMPWWFKALWFVLGPLVKRFFAISAEESGDRHLSLSGPRYPPRSVGGLSEHSAADSAVSTDGIRGGGAYAVDQYGEPSPKKEKRVKDYSGLPKYLQAVVWEHTLAVFQAIEGQGQTIRATK